MTELDITTPDGWIEREPEKAEQQLFVTTETYTYSDIAAVAKGHVAVYPAAEGFDLELYDGSYTFEKVNSHKEAAKKVGSFMNGVSNTL